MLEIRDKINQERFFSFPRLIEIHLLKVVRMQPLWDRSQDHHRQEYPATRKPTLECVHQTQGWAPWDSLLEVWHRVQEPKQNDTNLNGGSASDSNSRIVYSTVMNTIQNMILQNFTEFHKNNVEQRDPTKKYL